MTISHLLEDFGSEPAKPEARTMLGEEELEDFRLGAFEQGYSAGWEDATAAQRKENHRISAALTSNLEDISFTYHEAINQMTLSLEPLFHALIASFLPEVIKRSVGTQILGQLKQLARDQLDAPIWLVVPPGASEAIKTLLSSDLSLPIRIVEDTGLDGGQAHLRVGTVEREIDCGELLRTFTEAVDAYFHQIRKETRNG